MTVEQRLLADLDNAEFQAINALARYKFQMFGYWAAIWVHLNRVGDFKRPNPFREFVVLAKGATSQLQERKDARKNTK